MSVIKPDRKVILQAIQRTWETPYVSVSEGTYPIIRKKFSGLEVDHTDGIGTKGYYHWRHKTFQNAVQDALAMGLNDLAIMGARPHKLQNHIFIPEEDEKVILEILEALASECQKRQIAMTGGETSIHPNLDGLDISIVVSGFLDKIRMNRFEIGDVVFGVRSFGLHSNGFRKIRAVFQDEYRDDFVVPTAIHLDQILRLHKHVDIHGAMHITGGAFTKLRDILPPDADILIHREHSLKPQPIFKELYQRGVSDEEMYKTFNCGVGFIVSVSREDIRKIPFTGDIDIIGEVVPGAGKVQIESAFREVVVEY